MLVLEIFCLIMFGGSGWDRLIIGVMYIAGLYLMFRKSGIQSWWAFCPFAREYMLGKCAGREPEGRVTSVSAFLMTVFSIVVTIIGEDGNEYVLLTAALLILMIAIVNVVYTIRVASGLCEVYNKKKWWIIPWVVLNGPTALFWGLHKKFQPSWQVMDFRNEAIAHVTGKDVADVGEGLTVNLTDRSVTEFFQKKYLLKDIHLHIDPGHLVMLLGGSGAGKTTFLNAVNGYEKANATVKLHGRDVYKEYKKMLYEMGFVPQSDLVRLKDTVWKTLDDYAKMRLPRDFSKKDRHARINEAIDVFGLSRIKNEMVGKLSGGQRKRLSIAMEFISNPSLFILDEPDSGLDGVMARELFKQLRMVADTGRIVIVITHTPDRVVDLFDDVIILAKDSNRVGRLAYYGPVEECKEFFGKDKMEEIVKAINTPEEGGDGRADEFIAKYAEVSNV